MSAEAFPALLTPRQRQVVSVVRNRHQSEGGRPCFATYGRHQTYVLHVPTSLHGRLAWEHLWRLQRRTVDEAVRSGALRWGATQIATRETLPGIPGGLAMPLWPVL